MPLSTLRLVLVVATTLTMAYLYAPSGAAAAGVSSLQATRTVRYAQHDAVSLEYDVVQQRQASSEVQRRPVVILLHGGGWWAGSRRDLIDSRPLAQAVARAGFVAVVPDYRLACGFDAAPRRMLGFDFTTNRALCGVHVQDQVDDVLAVVRHVREHAGTLGVDATRIAILGVSAGGHLAMLAAEQGGASRWIQAVVNVLGPTATRFVRLQAIRPAWPARTIRASFTNAVGCMPAACPQAWRQVDPMVGLLRLRQRVPVLLVSGSQETQVPLTTMRAFAVGARRAGRYVDVVAGYGRCHGTGCLYGQHQAGAPSPLARTITFLRRSLAAH